MKSADNLSPTSRATFVLTQCHCSHAASSILRAPNSELDIDFAPMSTLKGGALHDYPTKIKLILTRVVRVQHGARSDLESVALIFVSLVPALAVSDSIDKGLRLAAPCGTSACTSLITCSSWLILTYRRPNGSQARGHNHPAITGV